jgi:hypothetical protein
MTDRKFNDRGNILISDQFNNRVIECNRTGQIVWSFGNGPLDFTPSSIIGVNDAQRIGRYTLMCGTGIPAGVVPTAPNGVVDNRVIIVDKYKKIVWQYGQFGATGTAYNLLNVPVQATYIPDERKHRDRKHKDGTFALHGTVLITDQGNNRVIRVDENGEIVWQYPGPNIILTDQLNSPNSAEKLKNGHILIADENNNRALEVNRRHDVVRIFTASGTLGACAFASRLCNGNTLLTDAGNNRIVEVNSDDDIVWQYITNSEALSIPSPLPTRAIRLENGSTIISDQFNNRVIVINNTNVIIAFYGLPLAGGSGPFGISPSFSGGPIGTNIGYNEVTTELGLYSPYDAKVIGDYTGITPP